MTSKLIQALARYSEQYRNNFPVGLDTQQLPTPPSKDKEQSNGTKS